MVSLHLVRLGLDSMSLLAICLQGGHLEGNFMEVCAYYNTGNVIPRYPQSYYQVLFRLFGNSRLVLYRPHDVSV